MFEDLKAFIAIYARYAEWYLNDATKTEDEWWPSLSEYPLTLTKEEWKNYIVNVEMSGHPKPMKMLKAMMELGGVRRQPQCSCVGHEDTKNRFCFLYGRMP